MAKFRKRPVVIEAFQWTGGVDQTEDPEWIVDAIRSGKIYYQGGDTPYLTIETLEGRMRASLGDYIIRGVNHEIYPCKPDIFSKTYDAVTDNDQRSDLVSSVIAQIMTEYDEAWTRLADL